jgi:hypothetical protein
LAARPPIKIATGQKRMSFRPVGGIFAFILPIGILGEMMWGEVSLCFKLGISAHWNLKFLIPRDDNFATIRGYINTSQGLFYFRDKISNNNYHLMN